MSATQGKTVSADTEITLFNPDTMHTTRYRYRGTAIPAPWPASG
jgi:RNA-directed DNA polymerase